jgi:hypothetical protein
MYANGCYWEADRRSDDLWVVGIGKTGGFPEPGIRILPLDPMGEMSSGVPLVAGVSVVRDHTPMKVFS